MRLESNVKIFQGNEFEYVEHFIIASTIMILRQDAATSLFIDGFSKQLHNHFPSQMSIITKTDTI